MRLCIIDTGSANLNSVIQAFKRLNVDAIVSSDIPTLATADKLILPGVGAAAACMGGVVKFGLKDFILENKKPLLGICLGMQILGKDSTEVPLGSNDEVIDTLGVVSGHVKALKAENLRLPHMGWNTVKHTDHPLFDGIRQDAFFYFDHSFAMETGDFTIGFGDYGEKFSAAIAKDNFMGVQFHPEKSSQVGEKLLQNFLNI